MTFDELRKQYSEFIFKDYSIGFADGECAMQFNYEIEGLSEFKTKWRFPSKKSESDPILERLAFSLGMVEAISYYKCACPKTVKVMCGSLSDWQNDWWRKLFYNGLGEFQYINGIKISRDELLEIKCAEPKPDSESVEAASPIHDTNTYGGVLVPVGGGKDSVVSLELLKDAGVNTYSINGNETTKNVISACKNAKADYRVKRILDRKILELNDAGYLNGHIPFSAVVAFSTVITSYLNGIKYIALSNESSANESTVKDSFVNHQYSKSFEFEMDFTEYVKTLSDYDIHYFSLLRPLSELQIAFLFSKFEDYHKVFRSCNVGSKKGIWCCDCAKCLFVYIILSPFVPEEKLIDIFGEKLLDKDSLDKEFKELSGIDENKPFECVGTRREVTSCISHFVKMGGRSLLTDRYAKYVSQMPDELDDIMGYFYPEHNVPEEFYKIVVDNVRES